MARKRVVPTSPLVVNITSLSDVMLSLLIFFMLVSKKGVETGADKKMALPVAFQGSEIADFGNTVTLNVYEGLSGEPSVTSLDPANGKQVTLPISTDAGKRPLQEFLVVLRKHNPDLKVIIRADGDLETRFLEPVLLTVASAKVGEINYATAKPE